MNEILNKIKDDINDIKTSQQLMAKDIAHHIKRTDLAEENLTLLRKEIEPLKKHVTMAEGAIKFIGIVSTVLGIIVLILKATNAI